MRGSALAGLLVGLLVGQLVGPCSSAFAADVAGGIAGAVRDEAPAAYGRAELSCRRAVRKEASRAAIVASNVYAVCHRRKARGAVDPGVNCANPAEADLRGRLVRAQSRMLRKVGGRQDRCAGADLGAAGYTTCVPGCGGDIHSSRELGDCLRCITEWMPSRSAASTMGRGVAPDAGRSEQRCNDTIARGLTDHLQTMLHSGLGCQGQSDRSALNTSSADCLARAAAPEGTIAEASAALFVDVVNTCARADFSRLDTCGGAQFATGDCVTWTANRRGLELLAMLLSLPPEPVPSFATGWMPQMP